MLSPAAQKQQLAEQARDLGFDVFGIAPLAAELHTEYFLRWIAEGQYGDMSWMARDPDKRCDPTHVLPGCRSIICCGLNYYQPEPSRRGRIAKYALGGDYHKLMLKRLKAMCLTLQSWGGENKPYVDTGPVLEKPLAAAAGLGWQAKNTLTINQQQGQWLFLGQILTTLSLPPDAPQKDRCGTCRRCLDACPTGAITAPYQLDARKCISYLTIEHKGSIPEHLRSAIGDHLYGCDDCLDVCPWNKWAQVTRESRFAPRDYPDLRDMLSWDDQTFLDTFSGSPIRRLKRERWLRNVCVVLGNIGTSADLPALRQAATDSSALIAEHAAWAINAIESRGA